ncbi:MAG: hypothetical protein KKF48_00655 [Nanoarchaeota archaeon]|nr:hypothetical protein [Nanoarchaeota archaeon]MBU1027533.1 hypothetical protein [Nanoarchaeota archaeon]
MGNEKKSLCEEVRKGHAFEEKDVTYCTIPRNTCPHNNEGHRIEYNGTREELKGKIVTHCRSCGLIYEK